jgi:hypothetical protein
MAARRQREERGKKRDRINVKETVTGRLFREREIIWNALICVSKAEPGAEENEQGESEERVVQLPRPARATLDKKTQPKSRQDKQLDNEHTGKGVIDMPDVFDHRDFFNHSRRNDAEDQ